MEQGVRVAGGEGPGADGGLAGIDHDGHGRSGQPALELQVVGSVVNGGQAVVFGDVRVRSKGDRVQGSEHLLSYPLELFLDQPIHAPSVLLSGQFPLPQFNESPYSIAFRFLADFKPSTSVLVRVDGVFEPAKQILFLFVPLVLQFGRAIQLL
jgi:hypothetical protein